MIIQGNTVGTTMPRTNYEQTDPKKADYLKGKTALDQKIADAKKAGTDAQTAASDAHTAATNAHTAATDANTAAANAQKTANDALPKAGGAMTGDVDMGSKKVTNLSDPTNNGDAANKQYVDGKHKIFSATLTTNDWVGATAPYKQTIGIAGILESDRPHCFPVYSADNDTALEQQEAWNMVCDVDTADGSVTFTCFADEPATAIPVQIEVNR